MNLQEVLTEARKLHQTDQIQLIAELLQGMNQPPPVVSPHCPPPESSLTTLERMGGIPPHLLNDGHLSDRDTRRNCYAR